MKVFNLHFALNTAPTNNQAPHGMGKKKKKSFVYKHLFLHIILPALKKPASALLGASVYMQMLMFLGAPDCYRFPAFLKHRWPQLGLPIWLHNIANTMLTVD